MNKGKGLTVEDVPKLWIFTLLYIISYVIIRLSIIFISEEEIMLENILINIGCTVLCSLILNMFIYYKYLKRIPQETKKSIDDLLNARLGYETSNHNAIMQTLNPSNGKLSLEHTDIRNKVEAVDKFLSTKEVEQKYRYELLTKNQQLIDDSVKVLYGVSDEMKRINSENIELKTQMLLLKEQNRELKAQKIQTQEYEHEI